MLSLVLAASHALTVPSVELTQMLPMLPPMDPGAAATARFRLQGMTLSAPAYLSDLETVAVLDKASGSQFLQMGDDTVARLPGDGAVSTQTAFGAAALAASGGASRKLGCVLMPSDATPAVAPLPLEGAATLTSVGFIAQTSDARLLVGVDDDAAGTTSIICLSADEPPATLLTGVERTVSACVSADERTLYLCHATGITRASLKLDEGACSMPVALPRLDLDGGSTYAVAVDVAGSIYVCSDDGVLLVDDDGDTLMRVTTPSPATGCCFAGKDLSEFLITAGDTVWSIPSNSQGVKPPSPEFLKYMGKLSLADGDFRHVGW